jgi:hypothetical protein
MRKLLSLAAMIILGIMLVSCDLTNDYITVPEWLVDITEDYEPGDTIAIKVKPKSFEENSRARYYVVEDIEEVELVLDVSNYELFLEEEYVYYDNGRPVDWLDYVGQWDIYKFEDTSYIIYEYENN